MKNVGTSNLDQSFHFLIPTGFTLIFFCNLIIVYFSLLPYDNSVKFTYITDITNFKDNTQITHTHAHSTHDTQRQYQYY